MSVRLPHDLSAARLSRRYVADLVGHGACEEFVYGAQLAVSELVSNAVVHGAAPLRLEVWHQPGRLRVEVTDTTAAHALFFGTVSDVGGLGLNLVAGLASAWGVEFCPADDTTTVSFEMRP